MARVFLPGIGFREPGVRLVESTHCEAAGRTLTLRDLIASPHGTELAYDLSYDDEGGDIRARESPRRARPGARSVAIRFAR